MRAWRVAKRPSVNAHILFAAVPVVMLFCAPAFCDLCGRAVQAVAARANERDGGKGCTRTTCVRGCTTRKESISSCESRENDSGGDHTCRGFVGRRARAVVAGKFGAISIAISGTNHRTSAVGSASGEDAVNMVEIQRHLTCEAGDGDLFRVEPSAEFEDACAVARVQAHRPGAALFAAAASWHVGRVGGGFRRGCCCSLRDRRRGRGRMSLVLKWNDRCGISRIGSRNEGISDARRCAIAVPVNDVGQVAGEREPRATVCEGPQI